MADHHALEKDGGVLRYCLVVLSWIVVLDCGIVHGSLATRMVVVVCCGLCVCLCGKIV